MRTFGTLSFSNGAGVASRSLGKPAAVFPGAVATDSTLIIGVDRQQTSLAATLNAGDVSMTVANAAMIVAYNLLSIDNEIVKTTGAPSGNMVPIQRGFDGTTPAIHLSGATVSGFVDAWHHNALVAEIEAIEQALGPNLSNLATGQWLVSSAYNFACQSPGGSLSTGAQTITLTPVPRGVNGTDTGHYLYITGGTGTAEAVPIIGGTAVSGAASGTVIVTCANAHSGAWTICSATAGIQEALVALNGAGMVLIPAGTFNIQGPISMNQKAQHVVGLGALTTVLNAVYAGGPLIDTTPTASVSVGANNALKGFTIQGSGGTNYAILINQQNSFAAQNLILLSTGNGIRGIGAQTFRVLLDDINVSLHTGNAFSIENGGDWIMTRCTTTGNNNPVSVGVYISNVSGFQMAQCDFMTNNIGLEIAPGNGQNALYGFVTDSMFDTSITSGVYVGATGTGIVRGWNFVDSWTCTSSGSGGVGDHGTGVTVGSGGTVDGVRFIGHRFYNNNTSGLILFAGTHITVDACVFAGNNAASGGSSGMAALTGNWTVRNSILGQSDGFPNTQAYGIAVGSGAYDNFVIENNVFSANLSGAIQNSATGAHNIIRNNQGYNPVGPFVITVGASPFTYTAGSSPETVYIGGGTVSSIVRGSTQIAAASPVAVSLPPNGTVQVTYTAAPTMVKDIL